jgi:glycosyltransferase involved in cell wall biosynthesis
MPPTEDSRESAQVEEAKHAKEEALHLEHYESVSPQEQSVLIQTPAIEIHPYSVLTIGTELAVLSPASPVRKRIFSYGRYFKAMHIILMSGMTGQGTVREDNVTVYPTNSSNKFARYFDALRMGKEMEHVDIVSAQDPFEIGYIALRVAKHHKAPLHVQVHTDFLAPEYAAHSFINKIRVMIAGHVIKRAAHVRVVSQEVYDRVRAKYGEKISISILPIYVDLERFQNAKPDASASQKFLNFPHRMLVVSRFEPEKNVSLAIRAFKEAAKDDTCLIILGEGSEYTMLERLVTKLGLDARVFFEGFKDPAPYYALADILLVPSVYEGYGQVIIEALAAGKPVLSTDVGIAKQSGAMIAVPEQFGAVLKQWIESGPKTMQLQNYPYASLDDFVRQYCEDLALVKQDKKAV